MRFEKRPGADFSRCILAFLCVLALSQGCAAREKDQVVDLELVLAVDVSASMDFDELRLQRQGYVAAFRSPELIKEIKSLSRGLAVTLFEWGDQDKQNVIVPWTLVRDDAGAEWIAARLEAAPLGHAFATSISGALIFAYGYSRITALQGIGEPSTFPVTDPILRERRLRTPGIWFWPMALPSMACRS
jgi:hypothetical protein